MKMRELQTEAERFGFLVFPNLLSNVLLRTHTQGNIVYAFQL